MKHLSGQKSSRYAAILKEKGRGGSVSPSRKSGGQVQIDIQEDKARLKVTVKNLKVLENDPYEIWLLDSSKQCRPIYLTAIKVNNKGNGEIQWDFDSHNIKGSGFDIDKFSHVAIANIDTTGTKKKKRIILQGELELHVAEAFDDLNMEKVDPFGTALPNHHWWKFYPGSFLDHIDNSGLGKLADHNETLKSGPVFRGHQLIGLHYDEKGAVNYLVHGIPGRFCIEDQPDRGNSGYVYWHPLPGQSYEGGHYGYWLIHINPDSGEVVFPRKQTPPPGINDAKPEDIE